MESDELSGIDHGVRRYVARVNYAVVGSCVDEGLYCRAAIDAHRRCDRRNLHQVHAVSIVLPLSWCRHRSNVGRCLRSDRPFRWELDWLQVFLVDYLQHVRGEGVGYRRCAVLHCGGALCRFRCRPVHGIHLQAYAGQELLDCAVVRRSLS